MGTFVDVKKNRASVIGFNSSSDAPYKDISVKKEEIVESGVLSIEFHGLMNGRIMRLLIMTPERVKTIITDIYYSPLSHFEEQYSVSISLSPNKIDKLADSMWKYSVREIYAEYWDNNDVLSVMLKPELHDSTNFSEMTAW